jgi:hypothetical protein
VTPWVCSDCGARFWDELLATAHGAYWCRTCEVFVCDEHDPVHLAPRALRLSEKGSRPMARHPWWTGAPVVIVHLRDADGRCVCAPAVLCLPYDPDAHPEAVAIYCPMCAARVTGVLPPDGGLYLPTNVPGEEAS